MLSECRTGVRSTTSWEAPSPEISVSSIAMKAGEETVRGFSAPPLPIVNVAGTRTFVAPPAAALAPDPPGGAPELAAEELLVGDVPAGELEPAELARVLELLVRSFDVLAAVEVAELADVLLDVSGEELVALALLVLCEELPHAATDTNTARQSDIHHTRLTRLSIGPRSLLPRGQPAP